MRKQLARAFNGIGDFLAFGWDSGESSRMRKDLGWGRNTPRDEEAMLSDGTRERTRLKAYDLRRNNAIVAGICERLKTWAVGPDGIRPQARTDDAKWNAAAEQWFADYSMRCDVSGRCSMHGIQGMAVSCRPTHGGIYIETMEDGTLRVIECERIRQPQKKDEAKNTFEGVRIDPATGRATAYRVHGRDANGGFGAGHSERWVSAENMIPVVAPNWRPDMIREMPDLAPVVNVLSDIGEMNRYTLNTAKVHSQITAWLQRQNGSAPLNSFPRGTARTADPAVSARQTFNFEWGHILELFGNETVNSFDSKIPNALHVPYMKYQVGLVAGCLNFPYAFATLDFDSLDWSRMKGMLTVINRNIKPWQTWVSCCMMDRIWNWRIAMAIRDGELPPAPTKKDARGFDVSQWNRVEWQHPEELWVDRQESQQADLLEWQLALTNLDQASMRRGKDFEGQLIGKARLLKRIAEIEKQEGIPAGSLVQAQIPGQAPAPAAHNSDMSGEKKPGKMPMEDAEEMDK